ncbi:probable pectinesterase/pectinesterase inhibitor 59 [Carica papaya]|uniref:probable pectinesterase/pectinesterase inhibitor 59 n=1 Tax=Carica papaya TaxID=3649 RepID=UPI000B8CDFDC|nr:probable pectinesterase/pectinesterase inhibitor 59 [Carica papaya]
MDCIKLILPLLFIIISFSTTLSKGTPSNITWWCNLTPHPDPCIYFMNHSAFAPKHRLEFRDMLVQVAKHRAMIVQDEVKRFGPRCETPHQRAAWADCLKLYDDTILQLDRTLQGLGRTNRSCTDFDVQTWLSTALTNIQTCHLGSMDLNVTDFIVPISSGNLSGLISNSLAINQALLKTESNGMANNSTGIDDFPSWVTRRERNLLQTPLSSVKLRPNLVVAQDGSGHFRRIQSAIDLASRRRRMGRFIIHVKKGVYRENIEVGNNNNNIMLVGDGMRRTIITSSRSVAGGYTTYNSATAGIDGLHFIARDITFSNTAGPRKGQAVALRSASDLSVFYRCAFQGYQDTLMVHSQRQFYKECYIYGTIDFIFGNAAVVFQNCMIFARRPLKGQANMITAQARGDPFQSTGITIHNSRILAAPDLKPVIGEVKTYLGRPWQQYSRTVIMKSYLDNLVSPSGWSRWGNSDFALDTLYYAEYKNFGPAASTRFRVRWRGFHVINSASASRFTVGNFIAGKSWLPATGVPFTSGL